VEVGTRWLYGCVVNEPVEDMSFIRPLAGGIAGLVGNPGGSYTVVPGLAWIPTDALIHAEIIMVRLQADMAKPLDKRLNYKHCFDGLFRVNLIFTVFP
jgi:dicarboxylate transporter 10